ncbi:MAG: nitroreductase [Planctomycetes bacterium DG_23]|nr:MAG: nitroreductase [Planctomycetes bacterium DG_23]
MNVSEVIEKRRSIRRYEDREIEEDKLRRVLEAGRLAPSASNVQEWKYVVVRDKELRQKLAAAAKGQAFVGHASAVIVGCAVRTDRVMSGGQRAYPIDLAISMDHMTLAAVEEGLGTCWIGAFSEPEVKKILGIPEEVRVVCLLPIGYPAESPGPKPRKSFEECVSWERWS